MSEFTVNTITLSPATASGNFSNWFDQLEAIGFTKVYYNDTLQNNKMRWKDSPFGIYISGTTVKVAKLKDDNTTQDINTANLITNVTTAGYTIKFHYRYVNDTNSILIGGTSNNVSTVVQQTLVACFYAPEDTNDTWNAYHAGIFCTSMNDIPTSAAHAQIGYTTGYPISSVELIPFWTGGVMKKNVYLVALMPNIAQGNLFRVVINDKVYLISSWQGPQKMGLGIDITDEDASAAPSA